MLAERISSSGKPSASSMAGWTASAKDFVPNSRSATSAASTMPGTSAGRIPATGTHSFSPPASGGVDHLIRLQLVVAEEIRGGQLGHRAHARDGVHLAVTRAHQDGRFAAQPEMRELRDGCGQHAWPRRHPPRCRRRKTSSCRPRWRTRFPLLPPRAFPAKATAPTALSAAFPAPFSTAAANANVAAAPSLVMLIL